MVRRIPVEDRRPRLSPSCDGRTGEAPILHGTARGFMLMEVVVSLALFGIFVFIIAQLTAQMFGYERRLPVNFMAHPQVGAVLSRIRRDVFDSTNYPDTFETYTQTPKTLILEVVLPTGFQETVVWDFRTKGEIRRKAFSVGNMTSEWVARGVPDFSIKDFEIEEHPDSVRVQAIDSKGRLSVDQIYQPRRHGQT